MHGRLSSCWVSRGTHNYVTLKINTYRGRAGGHDGLAQACQVGLVYSPTVGATLVVPAHGSFDRRGGDARGGWLRLGLLDARHVRLVDIVVVAVVRQGAVSGVHRTLDTASRADDVEVGRQFVVPILEGADCGRQARDLARGIERSKGLGVGTAFALTRAITPSPFALCERLDAVGLSDGKRLDTDAAFDVQVVEVGVADGAALSVGDGALARMPLPRPESRAQGDIRGKDIQMDALGRDFGSGSAARCSQRGCGVRRVRRVHFGRVRVVLLLLLMQESARVRAASGNANRYCATGGGGTV